MNTTTLPGEADPPSRSNKENLETTEMELEDDEEEELEEGDEDVSYQESDTHNDNEVPMEQEEQDEEESEESQDDQDETQDNKERRDELLPLSLLASKPFSRAIMEEGKCPQSASPISRKSRLSALAQSINSWEDNLGTPPKKEAADYATTATSGGKKQGPRFSISTPPPPTRLGSAQANKRNSCHQFIATATSSSVSPKPSPQKASSPTK